MSRSAPATSYAARWSGRVFLASQPDVSEVPVKRVSCQLHAGGTYDDVLAVGEHPLIPGDAIPPPHETGPTISEPSDQPVDRRSQEAGISRRSGP